MGSRQALSLTVLGLVLVFPGAAPVGAQSEILKAAVEFVRASGRIDTAGAPTILVDPRILIRGGPGSVPKAEDPQHAAPDLAVLNSAGRFSVPPLQRAIQCQLVAPLECKTNGRAITMRLGAPAVKGDSATVEVMTHLTFPEPTADSLAKLPIRDRAAVSRSWRTAFHARVTLVKQSGSWVATRMDLISRAG